MTAGRLTLRLLPGELAVVRRPAAAPVPAWLDLSAPPLACVTRTGDELSIVCPAAQVPAGEQSADGWRVFRIVGTFDFAQTGILASVLNPLAAAGVGIFALSTFDTDYILVQESNLDDAWAALEPHFILEDASALPR